MRSLVLLLTLLVVLAPHAAATPPEPAPAPARVNVGFEQMPGDLAVGGTFAGARVDAVEPSIRFARLVTADPTSLLSDLLRDPNVRYAMRDGIASVALTPDDTSYFRQYAPAQVRLPTAWDAWTGSTAANVCVVDTGVRQTHEDLAGVRYLGGHDFVNGDSDPEDDHFHGTHVAGIAAATMNNGRGIAGAAQVNHYAVKVLSASGSGYWSWVAQGIVWCADNAPRQTVISLSLGGGGGDSSVRDAIRYANNTKGMLVVAAMGNTGDESVRYPAAFPHVMAIASTDKGETRSSFSTMGSHASLAAPGSSIYSATHASDAAYRSASGTSMATPMVSGIAALVWSRAPDLSNADVRAILQDTAQDLGAPGHDIEYGWGEVDAYAALARVLIAPPDNVAAQRGSAPGEIELTWDAPSDGTLPTAYRIHAGDSPSQLVAIAEVDGATRAFVEHDVPEGRVRHYRVQSLAGSELGLSSPITSSDAARRPTAPLTAWTQAGEDDDALRPVVRWDAPADDGGLALSSYLVYRDAGDGYRLHAQVAAEETAFAEEAPLMPGQKARYFVIANNAAGASDPSNVACHRAAPAEAQPSCTLVDRFSYIWCVGSVTALCDAWNGAYAYGVIRPCDPTSAWYVDDRPCQVSPRDNAERL